MIVCECPVTHKKVLLKCRKNNCVDLAADSLICRIHITPQNQVVDYFAFSEKEPFQLQNSGNVGILNLLCANLASCFYSRFSKFRLPKKRGMEYGIPLLLWQESYGTLTFRRFMQTKGLQWNPIHFLQSSSATNVIRFHKIMCKFRSLILFKKSLCETANLEVLQSFFSSADAFWPKLWLGGLTCTLQAGGGAGRYKI